MRLLSIATTHPRWVDDSEPSFVHDLNRHLVARGHRVTTLLPHAHGAARREQLDGVTLRRFRYFLPSSAQHLFYDGGAMPNLRGRPLARVNLGPALLALANAIRRELATGAFDAVHCHWLVPQGLFVAGLMARNPLPWIATAHAGDVFAKHPAFVRANQAVLARAPLTTVNSSLTLARVRELDPRAPVEVIPMGVDVSGFRPDLASAEVRAWLGGGAPLVLFAGRFAEKKGVEYLLRAWPRIQAGAPGARLAIVGFGPREQALRDEIARLGLGDRVTMPGAASREQMAAALASADLFVAPSIVDSSGDTEGLGVVLLEALAAGTPVVASSVGGIVDIVEDGVTGLLVPEKDPDTLATACLRMLGDPALAARTVAAGQARIEQRFSWSAIAERFEAAFARIGAH